MTNRYVVDKSKKIIKSTKLKKKLFMTELVEDRITSLFLIISSFFLDS